MVTLRLGALVMAGAFFLLNGAANTAQAGERVRLGVETNQSVLEAGQSARAYLRVKLEGLSNAEERTRPPVNLSLVIDKSGSMTGAKLEQAKEAAILALSRLTAGDRVSVIAFNHNVEVIVPAGPFEKFEEMRRRIHDVSAGGQTAIYAAVLQASQSVKEATSPDVVSRVILLSDGQANVGPSTPADLERLGRQIGGQGISVTTIGLGLDYNEDLMSRLALVSDGNHSFVQNPEQLAEIFNKEFGDAFSVVGQDLDIELECPDGVIPRRGLGREVKIEGRRVSFSLNQIGGGQERYLVLELDIERAVAKGKASLADVKVTYTDPKTKERRKIAGAASVSFSTSKDEVGRSVNAQVGAAVAAQLANEASEKAVAFRDAGKVDDAKAELLRNAEYLRKEAEKLAPGNPAAAEALRKKAEKNAADAAGLSEGQWTLTRKAMRANQYREKTQQKY